MRKILITALLTLTMLTMLTGCEVKVSKGGPSSSKSAIKTVNGQTTGYAEKKTSGKGSASIDITENQVKMTNFEFFADPTGKVQGGINDDDIVFARAIAHDGHNTVWQNVVDGHYIETFNSDDATRQLNEIYQLAMEASDSPVTNEMVVADKNIITTIFPIKDANMLILLGNNTDKYIAIAYTTDQHNTKDILDAAYKALGGKTTTDTQSPSELDMQSETDNTAIQLEPDPLNDTSHTTAQPENETNITPQTSFTGSISDYSLEVGGVNINPIPIPEAWVVDASNMLIQCQPDNDTYVTYSDSYLKVNDIDDLNVDIESIESVNKTKVEVKEFPYNGQTGYILIWGHDSMRNVEIYEPVPGASTYLRVRITDYTGTQDSGSLIDKYCLEFH